MMTRKWAKKNEEAILNAKKAASQYYNRKAPEDAKRNLLIAATQINKVIVNPKDTRTEYRLFANARRIMPYLHHFELAMQKGAWVTACNELGNIISRLPFWHELIYNNLVRVFDEHLHTNMRNEMNVMFFGGKPAPFPMTGTAFFNGVMQGVEHLLKFQDNPDHEPEIYDYAITVLKEAYRTNLFERVLCHEEHTLGDIETMFPDHYIKDGKKVDVAYLDYVGDPIGISNICLVSQPYNPRKALDAFRDIKHRLFRQELGDYMIIYYPELNICEADNGFHHLAMASLLRAGEITPTKVLKVSELFPYVTSDGHYWIDAVTGTAYAEVYDYRAATIYELLRRKSGCIKP